VWEEKWTCGGKKTCKKKGNSGKENKGEDLGRTQPGGEGRGDWGVAKNKAEPVTRLTYRGIINAESVAVGRRSTGIEG